MQLYSGPLSLFSAKVRIALDEKAIPYDLITVPFSRAGYTPKHPEVVRINPKGQVPVLVDGDVALYDSTLILEYLEERYPDPPLYPRDVRQRVRCRQLEAAADEILFPSVWELIQEVFYKPDAAQRDVARVAAAQAAIAAHYARLDADLSGREFLSGSFSVADIGYFMTMLFAGSLGAPPAEAHTNLIAWSGRVGARPAVQREVEGITASARSI